MESDIGFSSGCEALVTRVIVVRPIVARETNVRTRLHSRLVRPCVVSERGDQWLAVSRFSRSASPSFVVLGTREVVGMKVLHDNERFKWRRSARRDRIPTQANMRQCGIVRVVRYASRAASTRAFVLTLAITPVRP